MRQFLLSTLAGSLLLASPALAIDFAAPHADQRARVQFDIGVDLVEHQHFEEAAGPLEVALEQFPDDTHILGYLGFAHRMIARNRVGTAHLTELRIANDYYMRALDIDPRRKDFLEYMGELYLEMDDPASADAKLAALTRECPNGCVQRDNLATAIAAYKPLPPPTANGAPAAAQDATAAPTPLEPPPATDD
ncbi:MAG TPA: hypothetical protein VMF58_04855 [Rhizomicrobium sp.]|nr:hypothetical protein [Rhizomicrobium sp.]